MTQVVLREGSHFLLGRAGGLVLSGVNIIYPIVGRYSTDLRTGRVSQMELQIRLRELAGYTGQHFGWAEWLIVCDETSNPPELAEERRLAVTIYVKPAKVIEFYGGTFIFKRVEIDGCGCLEIECYEGIPGFRVRRDRVLREQERQRLAGGR